MFEISRENGANVSDDSEKTNATVTNGMLIAHTPSCRALLLQKRRVSLKSPKFRRLSAPIEFVAKHVVAPLITFSR